MVIAFAVLLVSSAIYLAGSLKQSTGKKQNTFLLMWHIVNLILLTLVLIPKAIFYIEKSSPLEVDGKNQYDFYYIVTIFISDLVDTYVDLFLLWLLYRFMQPQQILTDGRTVATAIIFARDRK